MKMRLFKETPEYIEYQGGSDKLITDRLTHVEDLVIEKENREECFECSHSELTTESDVICTLPESEDCIYLER